MRIKTLLLALSCTFLYGHFGMVIPSDSSVENSGNLALEFKFGHPFENEIMNLSRPNEAAVVKNSEKIALLDKLQEKKEGENAYFSLDFEISEPSVYHFFMDPKPYFEPSEDRFIRHLTKTIVNAFGYGEGWDEPIGLKAEIVPQTRPFGLYAGNLFAAKVLYKGKPLKNAIVEVEYLNKNALKAPSEDHITQEIKTNENGEFAFVMPIAGWWGFAALVEDDEHLEFEGKTYPIELGAVIWVETKEYQK